MVKQTSFYYRLVAWIEPLILTRLVGQTAPGPLFRWIFKLPTLWYHFGLGGLIGGHILLLTTTGRKTGRRRHTPLEYHYDPQSDCYSVTAGWGGRTDWYLNARANPRVEVAVGRRKFAALAEPVPVEEVAAQMQKITRLNPRMLAAWQRWSPEMIDGSPESFLRAAVYFPSLRLRRVATNASAKDASSMDVGMERNG